MTASKPPTLRLSGVTRVYHQGHKELKIFAGLDLEYSPAVLDWRPCPRVELDNLGGRHRHLYRRVLESEGLQPALRTPPELDTFPAEDGWREHVAQCLAIYRELSTERVLPVLAAAT